MPLSPEYKHSYREITISGAATVPSPVARSRYLRFCCSLIYHLITEIEVNQFSDVGSVEGDAPLLTDVIFNCIKPLLHSRNMISSADGCCLSLSSTALRTAGRLAAEILFLPESFKGYTGSKRVRLKIVTLLS